MIKIDFEMRTEDEQELVKYFESIGTPEAFGWDVPNALFTFKINGIDFSDYHSEDTVTPVLEFATKLKSSIAILQPGYRSSIFHLDGKGSLEVSRIDEKTLRFRKYKDQCVDVDIEEMRTCIDLFCLRLYQEVIVKYRAVLEWLNEGSENELLDQCIDLLTTPSLDCKQKARFLDLRPI